MKKKLLAGALALAVLTGGTLAFAADQSQTLVSLGYLNGTFWDDLKAIVKMDVDRNTTALYNDAAEKVGAGGSAGAPAAQTGKNGDVVSAATGSVLVWTEGNGIVRSGTLVDATAGAEVTAGGALTVGHRYLAGTDVALVVTSGAAGWMAEGAWTVTAGQPVLPFVDVPQSEWYYSDVAYVYQNGLFNGDSPTTFVPDGAMERCMMTTVLHRLAGEPQVSYSGLFRDVADGQWYTAGIMWAGQQGVVSGIGDNLFDPFSSVTRQEIAVILHRYAAGIGRDVSQSASLSGFWDAATVADWGEAAMSWAVASGIVNGSDGALLPDGYATRAEVAAMLHRFVNWANR